mmetsp:Transcript_59355/g.158701  ORF Transcript_59355/g.158701 Transcript_59355/m.158701 type:complete len:237 (+) Transcript_59355:744-1454(+)
MTEPCGTAPTRSIFCSPSRISSTCDLAEKPIAPLTGAACSRVSGMCTPMEAHGPGTMVSRCLVCAGAPAGVSTTTVRSMTARPPPSGPPRKSSNGAPEAIHSASLICAAPSSAQSMLLRRYLAMSARTSGCRTSQSSFHGAVHGGTDMVRAARMRLKHTSSGKSALSARKRSSSSCTRSAGSSLSSTTKPLLLSCPQAASRMAALWLAVAESQWSAATTALPAAGLPSAPYRNLRR